MRVPQPITAVLQDCEFCGKITFSSRKKFYLSRKFSVTKFATSQSPETSKCLITSFLPVNSFVLKIAQIICITR